MTRDSDHSAFLGSYRSLPLSMMLEVLRGIVICIAAREQHYSSAEMLTSYRTHSRYSSSVSASIHPLLLSISYSVSYP